MDYEKLRQNICDNQLNRARFVDACAKVVAQSVHTSSGISGLGVKSAYTMATRLHPQIVNHALDGLIDDFFDNLEAHLTDYSHSYTPETRPLHAYFEEHRSAIAELLLQAADAKVSKVEGAALRSSYHALRSTAKKHVESAVAPIGQLIESYMVA